MSERYINKKTTKHLCWAEIDAVSSLDLITIDDLMEIILDQFLESELSILRDKIDNLLLPVQNELTQKELPPHFERHLKQTFNESKGQYIYLMPASYPIEDCWVLSSTPINIDDILWFGQKKDRYSYKTRKYKVIAVKPHPHYSSLIICTLKEYHNV